MAETAPTAQRQRGRPVHPTDLRSRILSATLDLLARAASPDEVTIAAITRAGGCTPPTLYHYWQSRDQLLREACGLGWSEFSKSQGEAAVSEDPAERIRARGRAYLRFATTSPHLFRVLFLTPNHGTDLGAGFAALVADAHALGCSRKRAERLAWQLWAAVHGVATLAWANAVFSDRAEQVLDDMSTRLLDVTDSSAAWT